MLDGCSTLDEVVATLQAAARAYKRLKAEGYELRGPIEDDYGIIRKVKKPKKKKKKKVGKEGGEGKEGKEGKEGEEGAGASKRTKTGSGDGDE